MIQKYHEKDDDFPHQYLYALSAWMACIFQIIIFKWSTYQILYNFSWCLSAVCLIPQLYLIKKNKETDITVKLFLAFFVLYNSFYLIEM